MKDSQNTLPPHLCHYTSQKGLLGILKTNKLWMTNILYLNDSSEFTHTLDLVKSELENRNNQLLKKGLPCISHTWENMDIVGRKYEVYQKLRGYYPTYYKTGSEDIYIFSLSTEINDLNQWRGYCPKEGGFCIEFKTEKIPDIIKRENLSFIRCEYNLKKKQEIVKSLFDKYEPFFGSSSVIKSKFSKFKTEVENNKLSDKDILEVLHHYEIINISSYLKDESFIKESEYRIVQKIKPNETKYRQGSSMIIPYIEGNLLDDDNKLPISKIWVGPTPNPELSKVSVDSLLKSNGYKDVKVKISKIPYRSWL
jgi:hypothetical protein